MIHYQNMYYQHNNSLVNSPIVNVSINNNYFLSKWYMYYWRNNLSIYPSIKRVTNFPLKFCVQCHYIHVFRAFSSSQRFTFRAFSSCQSLPSPLQPAIATTCHYYNPKSHHCCSLPPHTTPLEPTITITISADDIFLPSSFSLRFENHRKTLPCWEQSPKHH